jgi:hypothetical protein
MKRKHKPITKDLIKKHFGKDAKVHGFCGHYRVTTPGGEVTIRPNKINLVYGGDDIYRAIALLAGECWGGARAGQGSREFMLGLIAHGDAWGVNVQPDFRDRGAAFARWFVAIALFCLVCMIVPNDIGAVLALPLPLLVFWLMKRKARREEQRKIEAGGFHYPRAAQGAGYADEDQLRRGGLI